MKKLYAAIFILALLAAQSCSGSQATRASTAASDPPPVGVNADQPIGCHPIKPSAAAESGQSEPAGHRASDPIGDDMVFIKGNRFAMGTGDGLAAEGPIHNVVVRSFWIDPHEVTVAQFAEFVKAAGYKTDAEKIRWSGVFNVSGARWERIEGADWQHPEGPSSSAAPTEPVTQVSWGDAAAYASWANKRLPTEAEFEYAARGGLVGKKYAWGDALNPGGTYLANWWQGIFPARNIGNDGFIGRAPVGSFPANGYGLRDMTGNVWEWCLDWFGENYYKTSPAENPQGPLDGSDRVIRGGSWLCSENYCTGYRVAARNHSAPDTGLNNLGFRCARDN